MASVNWRKMVSCLQFTAKPEKCPGMSWVRSPQATRSVLVCHGHDLCHSPDGQGMPGETLHVLTIRQMAWITTNTRTVTSSGLRGPDHDMTHDIPGHFSVFAVIGPTVKGIPLTSFPIPAVKFTYICD